MKRGTRVNLHPFFAPGLHSIAPGFPGRPVKIRRRFAGRVWAGGIGGMQALDCCGVWEEGNRGLERTWLGSCRC